MQERQQTKALAILAGGIGRRVRVLTKGEHKSLLKLPDKSCIITRILRQAKDNDVKKIYVVYDSRLKSRLLREVTQTVRKMRLGLVTLDQSRLIYFSTIIPLNLICKNAKGNELVFVIEGDVVISDDAAKGVFSSTGNTFFIDDVDKMDNESMKAKLIDKYIREFSKSITNYPEFCGIMALDEQLRKRFLKESSQINPENSFYEYVFNNLIDKGLKIIYQVIPENQWNEIDNKEDYNDTIKKFKMWEKDK